MELLAGGGLIAAGVLAWRARPGQPFGVLLCAGGIGWFLLEWDNPGAGWPALFTAGLALHASCTPVLAHALLGYPDRAPRRVDRVVITVGYVVGLGFLGVLPALAFEPGAQACPVCPDNLLAIGSAPDVASWSQNAGLWLGISWGITVVTLLGRRLAGATVAGRRLLRPVLLPGIVYFGLSTLGFLFGLGSGFPSNEPAGWLLWLGQALALIAIAAGTAWERARVWRTRTAVARLVVDAARASPGRLRDALADMLGDPSLAVLFPLPDGRSVDAGGRPAAPAPGQAVTRLRQGGTEVALLAHREGLLDDPGLADGITSLARLALDTERLQAETLVQLADLRASRARIVDVGDAERRRLERDLHDGVQQRLVTLALSIRLARMRNGADADRLDRAETEVRGALAELREIAHGLCPAVLEAEGLAAGLEALAETLPVRLTLDGLLRRRFDRPVESAAYLVVAETVRRSGCTSASVWMSDGGERLMIAIDVPSGVGDLTDLRDRVGAVNGSLRLDSSPDGATVRAEFPCAS